MTVFYQETHAIITKSGGALTPPGFSPSPLVQGAVMVKPRLNDWPPAEQMRAALDYDPETGELTWRHRPDRTVQWNGKWAGKKAGTPTNGAVMLRMGGRAYRAHRVAWFLVYGECPDSDIDHANGDGLDNRIANLRIASRTENNSNRGAPKHNTSGFKGVTWSKREGFWRAQIQHKHKNHFLGYFVTPEEAHVAYREAASRLLGQFARFE